MSESEPSKACSHCHAVLPLSAFYVKSHARDGRQRECHNCANERIAAYQKSRSSEHPARWTHREANWRTSGIECFPGCEANRGFLCRTHYLALLYVQDWRCATCGRRFWRGIRPYPSADHLHRDAPYTRAGRSHSRGPIRGILCGGKQGCNFALGHYEARVAKGEYGASPDQDAAFAAYLADPPASRLSRSSPLALAHAPPARPPAPALARSESGLTLRGDNVD